jgi:hypothetical protein
MQFSIPLWNHNFLSRYFDSFSTVMTFSSHSSDCRSGEVVLQRELGTSTSVQLLNNQFTPLKASANIIDFYNSTLLNRQYDSKGAGRQKQKALEN